MVLRLVAMILGIVFVALGIPFVIIGLVADDGGAFLVVGLAALAVGAVMTAVFVTLARRAAAEKGRRSARAEVEVVDARLHQYTRIGVMLTWTATVRYADGRDFTRTVLVAPTIPLAAGERVGVAYDPADPGNFEVVARAAGAV